jgi:hypothetical protein
VGGLGSDIMAKVLKVDGGYVVYCEGCKQNHFYDQRWTFNGDYNKPTFSPSYLRRSGHYILEHKGDCWCTYQEKHPEEKLPESIKCMICHSFLTDGKLQFLSDCTHPLAGKTIDLEDVE